MSYTVAEKSGISRLDTQALICLAKEVARQRLFSSGFGGRVTASSAVKKGFKISFNEKPILGTLSDQFLLAEFVNANGLNNTYPEHAMSLPHADERRFKTILIIEYLLGNELRRMSTQTTLTLAAATGSECTCCRFHGSAPVREIHIGDKCNVHGYDGLA